MTEDVLARLAAVVRQRRAETADRSYTRRLMDGGVEACARKFGEEALETVIAALSANDEHLRNEAADVLYHLIVLLESRGVAWSAVLDTLEERSARSGLEEKAARKAADPA
jgi:phosphoribosyl-ATP pyrophosphohydrolase